MKLITEEWIKAADDDLLAAKSLAAQSRLTHISAFHQYKICLLRPNGTRMQELIHIF